MSAERAGEAVQRPADEERFDVVAMSLSTKAERFLARALTEKNADAVVMMAVMRRGVEEEIFFTRLAETQRSSSGEQTK